MRPWCVKCSGVVKMAKKMKINGRKLKDRGGDDLTVIFLARLQRVSQCKRERKIRMDMTPLPLIIHPLSPSFSVVYCYYKVYTAQGLIDTVRAASDQGGDVLVYHTRSQNKRYIMSINSLILPFITFPPLHSFGIQINMYVGVSYL